MIWWTKYAGVVSPLVSLLDTGNQWPFATHHPLPRLSFRLLGQQPAIMGRPRDPSFHLIDVSLSIIIVANIAVDNATIMITQINQVTFDIIKDTKCTMGLDSLYQFFLEFML